MAKKSLTLFVWKSVRHATDSYHSGGGVMVVAADETRARALALEAGATLAADELPDLVVGVKTSTETCFVFPDAGCC